MAVDNHPRVSETDIQRQLFFHCKGGVLTPNSMVYQWESDFLHITKNGYVHEYEIKTSKADLDADARKTFYVVTEHESFESTKHQILVDNRVPNKPNKFYFVLPKALAERRIPDYAGLLVYWTCDGRLWIDQVRRARKLHDQRISDDQMFQISRSLSHRYFKTKYFKD